MTIKERLHKKVLLLDGAMGTELQRRGMPAGACPETWGLKNCDILWAVHRDYVTAGSEVIYSNTFGGNRYKLQQYGVRDVRDINKKLVRLARSAALKGRGLVAGDIGPTGKFIEPFGSVKFDDAVNVFKEQIRGLLEGGADLLVIETMIDIQEARAALIAARELTTKFVMVTMTFEKDGRTLNGTDPLSALITLQSLGADAVGCNCSTGPREMLSVIRRLKPFATVPLVAKPNAGMPRLQDGKTHFEMDAKAFAKYGPAFVKAGVNLLGGCCGTTPAHLAALRDALKHGRPRPVACKAMSGLSSATDHLILGRLKRPVVIGECINPTGRKAFQQELRRGQAGYVRASAQEQKRHGAQLLDVNVGAPGVDEGQAMAKAVGVLANTTSLPLVIDSSNIKAVERALRLYPGRALINSISGEEKKLCAFLPVVKKYGAMFILLPLGQGTVPRTFQGRRKIIRDVLARARRAGFHPQDIIVDGLVMSVSSMPGAALETLKTVRWCAKTLQMNTVVGLSNVSFGLPARDILNRTFLSLLTANGLSLVIANPIKLPGTTSRTAKNLLHNKDSKAARYVQRYRAASVIVEAVRTQRTPRADVISAILEGNREEIVPRVRRLLGTSSAAEIVNDVMIPTINRVGDLFESKRYFLPQLVASAEAVKKAFAFLEPHLKTAGSISIKKTIVILATVKGDIHDIGKNIVSLMLKNHGFAVVDLGKDVSTARILAEIKRHRTPIVALSALMTTTMVNMREVIDRARKERLSCRFMVGGAVVTRDYAKELGAAYSKDGVEAVRVARTLSR